MSTKRLETLYSVNDAAKKLGGISKFTIYAWMSKGILERTRVGGRVMVKESSMVKLIKECSEKGVNRRKKGDSDVDQRASR